MALKPWYKVVTPREDLREGKPLDASEFAVHLDQVRDGRAISDYQDPELFFDKTYLTKNLTGLASEVVRRLSGIQTETSAIFNLATQFGGGKTHALTLLYHLAENGSTANKWSGVKRILDQAGVDSVPYAATAVFVGNEFDSLKGRGGDDGTPLRKTPWGEIAFQLGGEEAFRHVSDHEKEKIAPGGDVIRKFLPHDKPCLILMDELMNYISRNRKSGLASQLYSFLHNLSETTRGEKNVVLVVSIPASELEMSSEDETDYNRIKKLLDRLGKPVVMSAEAETSEIIRRRLFEWSGIPQEGRKVAAEYADWIIDHRQQIPQWFPIDDARTVFTNTYPFHPTLLSVFERKWQSLPRFQQTRGILRLLALWISKAYQEGFKGAQKEPLIGLGSAPLDDPLFRAAVFEQLGASKLEGAVTADICGKPDSHAIRLDKEAVDTIKKSRLHQKVMTSIFFESNGGQTQDIATVPEIRLAVAEPDLDIGNIETVLDTLGSACYFLTVEKTNYKFSLSPNLNKLLADRRASIKQDRINEQIKSEIQKVFSSTSGIQCVQFPKKSSDIADRPIITLVVLDPEHSMQDKASTLKTIDSMIREYGKSARTYKSAQIWIIAEDNSSLTEEARKCLAWQDIHDEGEELRLDDSQKRKLSENVKKAKRDLKECVWRTYKNIALLDKDNEIHVVDLGLVHSSAADSMTQVILNRLQQDDDILKGVSPNFLVRNWPPAFREWSTRAVRDAFYASPLFPRLLDSEVLKDTIAKGVASGIIAYVGKTTSGAYEPFTFKEALSPMEVELSDDMFIISGEEAKKHIEPPKLKAITISPENVQIEPCKKHTFLAKGLDQHGRDIATGTMKWSATGGSVDKEGVYKAGNDEGTFIITASANEIKGTSKAIIAKPGKGPVKPPTPPKQGKRKLSWHGEIPPQKWMNFYTKVLTKFASDKSLKLSISIEVEPEEGISEQKLEEAKVSLRELGLDDEIQSN